MVDEDDFVEKVVPVAPVARVAHGKKLVALLEYPHHDEYWYQFSAGHQIEDFGVLDDRDDLDRLLEYLEHHDVQVLLGIHAKALPDRGTMRKLDKIAAHAKQGLIVQLLKDEQTDETIDSARNQQWQTAFAERQIGLVSTG